MKKRIKLYLHHSHYEPITYSKRTGLFGLLLQGVTWMGNLILLTCYIVGWIVINLVMLPVTIFRASLRFPQLTMKSLDLFKRKGFRQRMVTFALCAMAIAGGVHLLTIVATGQSLKGKVLGDSDVAIGYLQDAKMSLEAQNTSAAKADLGKALEQFKKSEETLNSAGVVLQGILAVIPQKHDADNLLQAAQKITEAGIKGTELLNLTENMKLNAAGLNSPDNKATLTQAQIIINDTVTLADEAADLINKVSITSIPENHRPAFVAAKDAATFFQSNVSSLQEVSALVFTILSGSKNTLIVFQNNNEIRATGGFMGTVGNAKMTDGSLTYLDIRSVYDWDGQIKEKIKPPLPLSAVNKQLFLRDVNWFASFPDSADRIASYFEKAGGETPDLVIAITPEVILDMLDRTGPITLPQYGVTLTKENFIEQTQTETSVNYDKQLNQPKQFLADFFPLLMERLGNEEGGMVTFLEVFQRNLYTKQILLYSRNAEIQEKILAFNWGGELRKTERDYLSIVNTNLGGTKTDRYLSRVASIDSEIDSDGTITNTVSYTVKNPLPDNVGLKNISFTRFYVPAGSTFIYSEGFNQEIQLPPLPDEGYVIDEKVNKWQNDARQDTSSGTFIGSEAGKTWFGNWIEVKAGQEKTVRFSYTLPFKLQNTDRHSMLIQKQPGSLADSFRYHLQFPGRKGLWSTPGTKFDDQTMETEQNLTADSFIGIVLDISPNFK